MNYFNNVIKNIKACTVRHDYLCGGNSRYSYSRVIRKVRKKHLPRGMVYWALVKLEQEKNFRNNF